MFIIVGQLIFLFFSLASFIILYNRFQSVVSVFVMVMQASVHLIRLLNYVNVNVCTILVVIIALNVVHYLIKCRINRQAKLLQQFVKVRQKKTFSVHSIKYVYHN